MSDVAALFSPIQNASQRCLAGLDIRPILPQGGLPAPDGLRSAAEP